MNTSQNPSPFQVLDESDDYTSMATQRQNYIDALVQKWRWLLEGTRKQALDPIPESMYGDMAILFENQQAITRGVLTEATLKTDVVLPEKFTLPIIRSVFPKLIVNKVASIQPMPMSSGGVAKVFYQYWAREDVTPNTLLTETDYDYTVGAENSVPKRVKMIINSGTITAVKDILGATWSSEIAEDAGGALGIDVQGEHILNMAGEILREIEQRCLYDMLNLAGAGNVNWSVTVPAGYTQKTWYETLALAFADAEDLIFGYRFRKADWIIAGRNVAKYVRKMGDWKPEPRTQRPSTDKGIRLGVNLEGRVEGFWDVYTSFYIDEDKALMGVYPSSKTDTGFIFAPYIPMAAMPLVYAEYDGPSGTEPGVYRNVDKWTRNVRTRYGKMVVVPQLFATITLTA